MTNKDLRIVIAGAGIGGLVTALSLDAAGFTNIRIYERVRDLKPLGVGINVLPHAVRELTELGLGDAVKTYGVEPDTLTYFNRFGQEIWSEARGTAAGYRWPQVSVHRGEFQLGLADVVRERLGDIVELDSKLVSVEHGESFDTATFERSNGEQFEVEADVFIGADGIHSALRRQEYPDEGAPVWNGLTLWRGTANIPNYLNGRTMIMAGDSELKFVAYPLAAAPDGQEGTTRVNFIAEQKAPEGREQTADWNREVDRAPIVELFKDWTFDWLDVPGVIRDADQLLEYPMVDRNAIPTWKFGHSVLLGDAAHAMYPNGSNGSSQAILDARTLAYQLATADSVDAALTAYDEDRRPVTKRLLEMTRALGPERVMQLAYDRAPEGFEDINDVVPQAERQEIADSYKLAAGFHPEALNERASLSVPAEVQ